MPPTIDPTAPVVILGAGLTGLSAAYHLRSRPYVLVERSGRVGGKAVSDRREGHTFDVTGHWLHLRDERTKALMGDLFAEDALVRVARKTSVLSHGAELAYPFQANLHGLPLEVVQECLVGLVQARERAARGEPEGSTFEDYANARFGAGITRHFFIPYNTKLWGMHPNRLTSKWVSRYIPVPDVSQIIGGAIGLRQEGLGYNVEFLYPRSGGIDHLPEALRAGLAQPEALRLNTDVEEIDLAARRVKLTTEDDWIATGKLVSTMPLPELVKRIRDVPDDIADAAAALRWVRWRYMNVATTAAVPPDYHWAYVPETHVPFFRVGVFSNAVAAMAPEGCASLYVELNDRTGAPDDQAVVEGLVAVGAIGQAGDVRFVETREVEYAYVVFDDAHEEATARILAWLESQGVRSCGRYGAWIYNSMEDSILQGMDAATWAAEGTAG